MLNRLLSRLRTPAPDRRLDAIAAELEAIRGLLEGLGEIDKALYHNSVAMVLGAQTFFEDSLMAGHRFAGDSRWISRHPAQMASQNFEDFIIAEIFGRIGTTDKTFIEIGVGNGVENTTRFLLEQGWRGLWIEGDADNVGEIRLRLAGPLSSGALTLVHSIVTVDNVEALCRDNGFGGGVDLLSVDIDMNTSHVWRRLSVPARLACIEYNAAVHPESGYETPYDAAAGWDGSNRFGAALGVLEAIGRDKEMALVGCDSRGINAFFVREALASEERFIAPFTAAHHYEPPRYGLVSHRGHTKFSA